MGSATSHRPLELLHIPELAAELRKLSCVQCGCIMPKPGPQRVGLATYTTCPGCEQLHHVAITTIEIKGNGAVEVWVPFIVEICSLKASLGEQIQLVLGLKGGEARIAEVRGVLDRWVQTQLANPFDLFVAERLTPDPESWLSTRDLHDEFQEWSSGRGLEESRPLEHHHEIKALVDAMRKAGLALQPVRWHNERGYVGVRFREDPPAGQPVAAIPQPDEPAPLRAGVER